MPALSPTMSSGTIGTWNKNVGDRISPGEILVEIETDKAQVDFEFQDEGYIAKILLESGTKDVNIGSPIAVLVEDESDVAAFSDFTISDIEEKSPSKKEEIPNKKNLPSKEIKRVEENISSKAKPELHDRVFASPVARMLAKEKGIQLEDIKGSGPNGRIIKVDIENYKPETSTTQLPVDFNTLYTDIPLSNIRRTIASRLTESVQNTPHFYITLSIHMEKVLKLREALNNRLDDQYKISINDIIVKASAIALQKVPEVNSSWFGSFIRQYHSVDISVAVATPNGLITPIIKDVQNKGLLTINKQVRELANKARDGRLKPEEYQGGTFTISNMGMYGIEQFTAIINPPQASILAVGSIENFLVEDLSSEKGFKTEKRMKVTLSSDHRIVDGAVGAKWATTFKSTLENPLDMLL
ncbi:hypothetical protein PMAC_003265 [Pneumocystis sp. 'macacae']|nr:hypothetical protein PMAC_003265 [Pneumocystis sp. 'macacae']